MPIDNSTNQFSLRLFEREPGIDVNRSGSDESSTALSGERLSSMLTDGHSFVWTRMKFEDAVAVMMELLSFLRFVYSIFLLIAAWYLIRSINKSLSRDYVYCHLFCIGVCIAFKVLADASFYVIYVFHLDSSDWLDYFASISNFSLLGIVLYTCSGSIAFLLTAHVVYSKEDEHADGLLTKLTFVIAFLFAGVFAMSFVVGNDSMQRISMIAIIASWFTASLLIIVMSCRFLVHIRADPFAKRQFFLCILFTLVTVGMQMPTLTYAFFKVFNSVDAEWHFTAQYGIAIMYEAFPLVTLMLAFAFFPSVRHGLHLILHPPPPPPVPISYDAVTGRAYYQGNGQLPTSRLPPPPTHAVAVASAPLPPPPPYTRHPPMRTPKALVPERLELEMDGLSTSSSDSWSSSHSCPPCPTPPPMALPPPTYSSYPTGNQTFSVRPMTAGAHFDPSPAYSITLPNQVDTPRPSLS